MREFALAGRRGNGRILSMFRWTPRVVTCLALGGLLLGGPGCSRERARPTKGEKAAGGAGEGDKAPAASGKKEQPSASAEAPSDEQQYAVVVGRVRLAEEVERLPRLSYQAVGLPKEAPPEQMPEECPPWSDDQLRPLKVGDDRALGPVLVSVVGFRKSPPASKQTHRVVIRNCRLEPTLIAARVGDEVQVVNESDYPFLPTLGPSPFLQALPKGQSRTFPLPQGGVTTLYCGFNVPCGWTGVIVQHHPVFAVTKPDGSFRIEQVPIEGDEITIHAWHPLLAEASQRIEPKPGQTLRVELTLSLPERHRPAGDEQQEPAPPEGDEGVSATAPRQSDRPQLH